MDFIIANVIANATEAAETINQGRTITLFPNSETFGNVGAKSDPSLDQPLPEGAQKVAENEAVQQTTQISNAQRIQNSQNLKGLTSQIIPLATGILSVYLGWTCDTKKGVKGIGKFLLAILYFLLGGLHIIVYFIKWIFGSRCKPSSK